MPVYLVFQVRSEKSEFIGNTKHESVLMIAGETCRCTEATL